MRLVKKTIVTMLIVLVVCVSYGNMASGKYSHFEEYYGVSLNGFNNDLIKQGFGYNGTMVSGISFTTMIGITYDNGIKIKTPNYDVLFGYTNDSNTIPYYLSIVIEKNGRFILELTVDWSSNLFYPNYVLSNGIFSAYINISRDNEFAIHVYLQNIPKMISELAWRSDLKPNVYLPHILLMVNKDLSNYNYNQIAHTNEIRFFTNRSESIGIFSTVTAPYIYSDERGYDAKFEDELGKNKKLGVVEANIELFFNDSGVNELSTTNFIKNFQGYSDVILCDGWGLVDEFINNSAILKVNISNIEENKAYFKISLLKSFSGYLVFRFNSQIFNKMFGKNPQVLINGFVVNYKFPISTLVSNTQEYTSYSIFDMGNFLIFVVFFYFEKTNVELELSKRSTNNSTNSTNNGGEPQISNELLLPISILVTTFMILILAVIKKLHLKPHF